MRLETVPEFCRAEAARQEICKFGDPISHIWCARKSVFN